MDLLLDFCIRTWQDITSGRHAPLSFRFILQPAVAAFFAYRAGRQDAREGRPPYTWTLLRHREQRKALLLEGWRHIGKVFVVAIVMDGVYQFILVRWFYPVEALMVAIILAVVPYLLLRGVVNRILSRRPHT